jgi:hypothetical protein
MVLIVAGTAPGTHCTLAVAVAVGLGSDEPTAVGEGGETGV